MSLLCMALILICNSTMYYTYHYVLLHVLLRTITCIGMYHYMCLFCPFGPRYGRAEPVAWSPVLLGQRVFVCRWKNKRYAHLVSQNMCVCVRSFDTPPQCTQRCAQFALLVIRARASPKVSLLMQVGESSLWS